MKRFTASLTLYSNARTEVLDITPHVHDMISRAELEVGIMVLNALGTPCGLMLSPSECSLRDDFIALLEELVPRDGPSTRRAQQAIACPRKT